MEMNKTRSSVSIEEFSNALTYIELVLIGVIMIFICVVTIIGNALVVISFIMDKRLRTLSNYFLLSLAVSDMMIATFSMPLYIVYLLIGEWTLGPAVCDMWLAQDYTCSNASGLNLLMIAIDRYFSVTNPLRYRAKRTGKRVGIMISCVWIISFLTWPPWIYSWPYIEGKRTVPEDDCYVQFLETNSYVTIITTVIDYYIPVLIILVLYYRIWRETKRRSKYLADMETGYRSESMCLQKQNSFNEKKKKEFPMKLFRDSTCQHDNDHPKAHADAERDTQAVLLEGTSNNKVETTYDSGKINEHQLAFDENLDYQRSTDLNIELHYDSMPADQHIQSVPSTQKGGIKADNKAARVLTAILLAFIITTTPYNVLVIIKNLDSSRSIIPDSTWNFFYYLFYVNSTLNPLCYALANENFRKTYWQILTCSWSKKPQGSYSFSNYSNKSAENKSSYAKYAISPL